MASERALRRSSSSTCACSTSGPDRISRRNSTSSTSKAGLVESCAIWRWLTPRGTWQSLGIDACSVLERTLQAGEGTCVLTLPNGMFEFDICAMTMRPRGSQLGARKIRRDIPCCEQSSTAEQSGIRPATPATARPSTQASRTIAAVATAPPAPPRQQVTRTPNPPPLQYQPANRRRASRRPSQSSGTVEEQGRATGTRRASAPNLQQIPSVVESSESDEAMAMRLQREEERRCEQASRRAAHRFHRDEEALLMELLASQTDFWDAGGDAADIDGLSYEDLLQLGERIGYAPRPHRPTEEQLACLPTRCWESAEHNECDEVEECAICCDGYNDGEKVRTLPCMHSFHARCIDQWLTSDRPGARLCPVCKAAVGISENDGA